MTLVLPLSVYRGEACRKVFLIFANAAAYLLVAPTATAPGAHVKRNLLTTMKTIDEMLHLDLLTSEQHVQIDEWIARAASPDEILKMPAPLWRAIERASEVMGIDQDLMRAPPVDAADAVLP